MCGPEEEAKGPLAPSRQACQGSWIPSHQNEMQCLQVGDKPDMIMAGPLHDAAFRSQCALSIAEAGHSEIV